MMTLPVLHPIKIKCQLMTYDLGQVIERNERLLRTCTKNNRSRAAKSFLLVILISNGENRALRTKASDIESYLHQEPPVRPRNSLVDGFQMNWPKLWPPLGFSLYLSDLFAIVVMVGGGRWGSRSGEVMVGETMLTAGCRAFEWSAGMQLRTGEAVVVRVLWPDREWSKRIARQLK